MSHLNIEVRGHNILNKPASRTLRMLSHFTDFCVVAALFATVLAVLEIPPLPSIEVLTTFSFLTLAYWIPQKILFGLTLGERSWQLKIKKKKRYQIREKLFQYTRLARSQILSGSMFSAAAFLAFSVCTYDAVVSHPLWRKTTVWKLEVDPFVPSTSLLPIPFFFYLGGWPVEFNGKPVFYSVTYEKGPPTHFVGHITANWASPNIKVIMEGPKTPDLSLSRENVRDCFRNPYRFSCVKLKNTVIERHLDEAAQFHPKSWRMNWFEIVNPDLPSDELPQGVYLTSSGDTWIQDRFIIINSKGMHQTLILNRSKNEEGEQAFDMIQRVLGHLRNYNLLGPGRTWIDQQIGQIRLDELRSIEDPQVFMRKIAEIQSLLISKISVDPANLESYFHLAGTSLILLQYQKNPLIVPRSVGLQNLRSAYLFANDISPSHALTSQIQALWREAKKN